MAGPTWEERREIAGPNRKVAEQRRGSKSLAQPQFPLGLAHISLPHPSFSTTGCRRGQAGVAVRHRATSTPTTRHQIHPPSPATSTPRAPDQTRGSRASGPPRECPHAADLLLQLPLLLPSPLLLLLFPASASYALLLLLTCCSLLLLLHPQICCCTSLNLNLAALSLYCEL
ncbi:hypothetical protein VPH35_059640 [Triticum aestivum]